MNQEPDWASPPGDTIQRLMRSREIAYDELADALHLDRQEFHSLLEGKSRLTIELAEGLVQHLGSTVRFWVARDKSYLRDLARVRGADAIDAVAWAASMPVASMRRDGWLQRGRRTREGVAADLLSFFGCSSLQEWGARYSTGVGAVAFRASVSFPSDDMATLVWLRLGETEAAEIQIAEYDEEGFRKLLPELRRISAFKHPNVLLERLREACGRVGVHITSARAPDGCRASGASWFGPSGRPIIHLSFRHLSEDHFWFTLFHESAHILLHGREHIDGEGQVMRDADDVRREQEADDYAREKLLPEEFRSSLMKAGGPTPLRIRRFAREAGVTPGIFVGFLEYSKAVEHGRLSSLKRRYRWADHPRIPILKD